MVRFDMQGELAARKAALTEAANKATLTETANKAALTELKAEVSALKDEITKARGGEALSATRVDSPYSSTIPLS